MRTAVQIQEIVLTETRAMKLQVRKSMTYSISSDPAEEADEEYFAQFGMTPTTCFLGKIECTARQYQDLRGKLHIKGFRMEARFEPIGLGDTRSYSVVVIDVQGD